MAGDWIKMEHVLPDKPEVVRMAAALGIDQDAVVGKLFRFWVWADQQCQVGDAAGVTETFIDRYTFQPGLAAALRDVGWLTGTDGALVLPNFERHNGKTAKTRALTRKRTETWRNGDDSVTETQRVGDAANVTSASPEKRREEKRKKNTTRPAGAGPDPSIAGHDGTGAVNMVQNQPQDAVKGAPSDGTGKQGPAVTESRPEDLAAARKFADAAFHLTGRKPRLSAWAAAVADIRRNGGGTNTPVHVLHIEAVADWIQTDAGKFWRDKLLKPGRLKKHFQSMFAQLQTNPPPMTLAMHNRMSDNSVSFASGGPINIHNGCKIDMFTGEDIPQTGTDANDD